MNYFGISLWTELLLDDPKWKRSLGLPLDDEFEPTPGNWYLIFDFLKNIIHQLEFEEEMGGCFQVSSQFVQMLVNFDLIKEFRSSIDSYSQQLPLDFCLHSTFGRSDLILSPKYYEVLKNDYALCHALGGSCIVEHSPLRKNATVEEMIEILTQPKFINLFNKYPQISLAWENMPTKNRLFGCLQDMVEFRALLAKKLESINQGQLIRNHLFCLDTGHLLISYYRNKRKMQQDIAHFLPEFGKYLKTYHIHANSGKSDAHMIPCSKEFLNHPSRPKMRKKIFQKNSAMVLEWVAECEKNATIDGRHIHLEALRLPFSANQILEFGHKFTEKMKEE